MKEVLDEYGILFISDEVQTGWGRTGEHFWGYEAHGVVPDMLTFAKGLGNGLAIAGVVARGDLMDSVPANSISTFGGNPLVDGGRARQPAVPARPRPAGQRAARRPYAPRTTAAARGPTSSTVGEVRGKGLMIGIELVGTDGRTPSATPRGCVPSRHARRAALLIGKGGLYGNCLRLAPPLSITLEEAEEGAAVIADALARLSGEEGNDH